MHEFGGQVSSVGAIVHGKTSMVQHDNKGFMRSVTQPLEVTRYHSLSCDAATMPNDLEATSTTVKGSVVMGVRHKQLAIEGVQYHPESIASAQVCTRIFSNFLQHTGGYWNSDEIAGQVKAPSMLLKIRDARLQSVHKTIQQPGHSLADYKFYLMASHQAKVNSLYAKCRLEQNSLFVIAEFKRRSPSCG